MLHRMQLRYAGKPVRFLLVPCNQFGAQEPKANSIVKAFAEGSVHLGAGSGVVMLAKSNLNGVKCTYDGADACTPSSTECCPKNDAVYDYLLANTPPGQIKWNFDKIIVGADGKPYKGETVLHGPALDAELSAIIDALAAEGRAEASELTGEPRGTALPSPWLVVASGALCAAGLAAAWLGGYSSKAWQGALRSEALAGNYVAAERLHVVG
mmetsp:Transcript_83571/g.259617  ORF Transcript_83571/g.259617 Transcript_83571/m.259617 type:complete len:211 (+) Transcript_83571:253-885(+)